MTNARSFQTLALLLVLIIPVEQCTQEAQAGPELQGQVTSVHDGDTFELRTASRSYVRVRLAKIDAPELAQPNGVASRSNLEKLVGGQFVVVNDLEPDKYGRTVGRVWLQGLDINGEQVKTGYAWAYMTYDPPIAYMNWENDAKRAHRGLWADPYPQPPWEYRHSSKGKRRH